MRIFDFQIEEAYAALTKRQRLVVKICIYSMEVVFATGSFLFSRWMWFLHDKLSTLLVGYNFSM